jgi:hypothetical protein
MSISYLLAINKRMDYIGYVNLQGPLSIKTWTTVIDYLLIKWQCNSVICYLLIKWQCNSVIGYLLIKWKFKKTQNLNLIENY